MPGVQPPELGKREPDVDEFDDPEFDELDDDGPGVARPAPRVGAVRRRSMGGAMLAAAMIGLQEALDPPKEPPIVLDVLSGADDDDEPIALDLDPVDPSQSVAVVRPWLRRP